MPRSGRAQKRKIGKDSIYGSVLVQKFIHQLTLRGKKSKAEAVLYQAMDKIRHTMKKEPLEIFEKAIQNVTPLMQVRPRRVGGATYQVPMEVPREKGISYAMKWLRDNARGRNGHSMMEKLSAELMDAFHNTGPSIKKREDVHKMAEANKAFAHFRW